MKKTHLLLITLFIGLTLLMSACATGPRVTDAPGLAVDDTDVFVAYSTYIFSLDGANGSVNWAYPEKGSAAVVFYAPPLVTDDAIYIGDLANTFHKLDKTNGEEFGPILAPRAFIWVRLPSTTVWSMHPIMTATFMLLMQIMAPCSGPLKQAIISGRSPKLRMTPFSSVQWIISPMPYLWLVKRFGPLNWPVRRQGLLC